MFEANYFKDKYHRELTEYTKALFLEKLNILQDFMSGLGIFYRPTKRLLDIGCAYGHFLIFSRNYDSVGVDVSSFSLNVAKSQTKSPFVRCDAKNLPFRKESFDVVTIFEVIEHLENPIECLFEIHRILKHSGIIFLSTPNKIGLREFLAECTPFIKVDKTHINLMTKNQVKSLLQKSCFKSIMIKTSNVFIYLPKNIFGIEYVPCIVNWPLATTIQALALK